MIVCFLCFFQGETIKNLNKKQNFKILESDIIPLYRSSNQNYYYTFLFVGNPPQKIIVSFSILSKSNSILLCQYNKTTEFKNAIYTPSLSNTSLNISNGSAIQNPLYYLNKTQFEFISISIFDDSNVHFGTLVNGLMPYAWKIILKCMDYKYKTNLFDETEIFISGIINLSYDIEANQEDLEFNQKIKFGYVLLFNETHGYLKILTKLFELEKYSKYFTKVLEEPIQFNEVTNLFLFPFSYLLIGGIILKINTDKLLVGFSILVSPIQFSKKIYDEFLNLFEEFCKNNERKCLGKMFSNLKNCFFNENLESEEFFQSFPEITLKINETFIVSIRSSDYFIESSKNFYCIGIEKNERIENKIIFGNNFLLNKMLFIDSQKKKLILLIPKPILSNFADLFQAPNSIKQIQLKKPINALEIVLPLVFSFILITTITVHLIKRYQIKNNNLQKFNINQEEIAPPNEIQNTTEISYENYKKQKIPPKKFEFIDYYRPKESLDRLLEDHSKNMTTKSLEEIPTFQIQENNFSDTLSN